MNPKPINPVRCDTDTDIDMLLFIGYRYAKTDTIPIPISKCHYLTYKIFQNRHDTDTGIKMIQFNRYTIFQNRYNTDTDIKSFIIYPIRYLKPDTISIHISKCYYFSVTDRSKPIRYRYRCQNAAI